MGPRGVVAVLARYSHKRVARWAHAAVQKACGTRPHMAEKTAGFVHQNIKHFPRLRCCHLFGWLILQLMSICPSVALSARCAHATARRTPRERTLGSSVTPSDGCPWTGVGLLTSYLSHLTSSVRCSVYP